MKIVNLETQKVPKNLSFDYLLYVKIFLLPRWGLSGPQWKQLQHQFWDILGYPLDYQSINQSIRNVECLLWVSTSKFKTHECHRQDVSETSFVWTSTYLSVTFQVTQYYIVQESFPRLSQDKVEI